MKKVNIYGAGLFFIDNISWISKRYEINQVYDSDTQKQGKEICGYKIEKPDYEEMKKHPLIISAYEMKRREILAFLENFGEFDIEDIYENMHGDDQKNHDHGSKKIILYGPLEDCRFMYTALPELFSDVQILAFAADKISLVAVFGT